MVQIRAWAAQNQKRKAANQACSVNAVIDAEFISANRRIEFGCDYYDFFCFVLLVVIVQGGTKAVDAHEITSGLEPR